MINLIHGENITASRDKLNSLIQEFSLENVYLDGRKLSQNAVIIALESNSLFAAQKLVVIENFFQAKKSKEKTAIEEYLFGSSFLHELIFWENKKIERIKSLKLPKSSKIYTFDFDGNIFKFLDSLGKLTFKETYRLFHNLLKTADAELIHAMLVRQFRMLLLVKESKSNYSGLPDWQFYKFKSQSDNFKLDALVSNYRMLLNLDFKLKSGKIPYKKEQLLDIFFSTL